VKKPYESHEIAYQKMRQLGIKQWGGKGSGTKGSFSYETKRFLKDVLSQPWAPKGGKAVEFGCGTGPIIRWICERGFSGLGLDISKTAHFDFGEPIVVTSKGSDEQAQINEFITARLKDWESESTG